MRFLLVLVMLAGPLAAETCPDAPDHDVAFARLVEEIRAAPDERAARPISMRMWELWADAPDDAAQAILDRGMRKRASFDLLGARADFDALVRYCPEYAEGYNQRAFVNFIRQDYAVALPDLTRALELNPTHIGALTGRAMTYFALGRMGEGQADLRRAVGLNPWLKERAMLQGPGAKGRSEEL